MTILAMIDRFFRGAKSQCWVCRAPVRIRYPESIHHSPLGGGFSLDGCATCKSRRAVTRLHACWFMTVFGLEDGDPIAIQEANETVDADGKRFNRSPVHVLDDGLYFPFLVWVTSERAAKAMQRFASEAA